MFAIGTVACATFVLGCFFITLGLGAAGDVLSQIARSLILTGTMLPKNGLDVSSILAASLSAVLTKILGTGVARYLASKFIKIGKRLIEFITDFVIETSVSRPVADATVREVKRWTN
jgi:hypothetical protein